MKIETIEVAGLAGALAALRLPFGKEVRSEINGEIRFYPKEEIDTSFYSEMEIFVNDKDLTLMQTLVKRGDEHAKVVRGIMVWAKITAPVYWWWKEDNVYLVVSMETCAIT